MTTPLDAETNPATIAAEADPEVAVGRLEGVRPCLQCGHDLHGQVIVRETTYGLLIARCPECGSVAALSEHPRLGIWGRRLGTLLMTTMLALLVPLLLLTALAIFGIAAWVFDELARDARSALGALNETNQITPEWWAANGVEATRAVVDATFTFDGEERAILTMLSPIPILLGVIWSGILVAVPRRRLWLVAVATGAIAFCYVWIGTIGADELGVQTVWYYGAVFEIMAWPVTGGVILLETGLMAVGLLLGRPLLRRLAGFILPPRPRRSLSFLWTVDGLEPPRGRG